MLICCFLVPESGGQGTVDSAGISAASVDTSFSAGEPDGKTGAAVTDLSGG